MACLPEEGGHGARVGLNGHGLHIGPDGDIVRTAGGSVLRPMAATHEPAFARLSANQSTPSPPPASNSSNTSSAAAAKLNSSDLSQNNNHKSSPLLPLTTLTSQGSHYVPNGGSHSQYHYTGNGSLTRHSTYAHPV